MPPELAESIEPNDTPAPQTPSNPSADATVLSSQDPTPEAAASPQAQPSTPEVGTPAGDSPTPQTPDPASPTPPALTVAPEDYFKQLPDNWRQMLGGGDEKRTKHLERVLDMDKFVDNYFNMQEKISRGEISSGLPENPTEEQIANYRVANGIPESADGYEPTLEQGLVLGEDDKAVMDPLFETAHKHNIPAGAMSDLVNTFLKGREAELNDMKTNDGLQQQTATRHLRETWGADFDLNRNLVQGLINQLPEDVRDAFASARLPDGSAVFNKPEMMVFFADMARKLDPSATVVPNSANPMQSINDEIKRYEEMMGTDEWYKDKEAQQRYVQLIDARDRMGR